MTNYFSSEFFIDKKPARKICTYTCSEAQWTHWSTSSVTGLWIRSHPFFLADLPGFQIIAYGINPSTSQNDIHTVDVKASGRTCGPVENYPLNEIINSFGAIVDNAVMVCGGIRPNTDNAFNNCYRLRFGAWEPMPSLLEARHTASATMTSKGLRSFN